MKTAMIKGRPEGNLRGGRDVLLGRRWILSDWWKEENQFLVRKRCINLLVCEQVCLLHVLIDGLLRKIFNLCMLLLHRYYVNIVIF